MGNKNKKSKNKVHVTYNKKVFLVPDSLLSMAAMHCKIKPDGEAQIRISDCNNTVKLWNDLNDPNQVVEFLTKIKSLKSELDLIEQQVKVKLPVNYAIQC